jgi:putative redox protein
MKQKIEATTHFDSGFSGSLDLKDGSIPIGIAPNQVSPYRMLQGALIGCFHSTFLDIIQKKRVTYERVTYKTFGEKRDEVPATLETLHIDIYISNVSNQLQIEKSYALATKVCSVYQTLTHVANLSYSIHFE